MASPDDHIGQEDMLPEPGLSSPRAFFRDAVRHWTDSSWISKFGRQTATSKAPFARKTVFSQGCPRYANVHCLETLLRRPRTLRFSRPRCCLHVTKSLAVQSLDT